jgi:hypothetical protein
MCGSILLATQEETFQQDSLISPSKISLHLPHLDTLHANNSSRNSVKEFFRTSTADENLGP